MFAFVHIKKTKNIGDLVCTPMHYFDFPDKREFDVTDAVPDCEAAIFGGGAIEWRLRGEGIHRNVRAKKRVAWGIGSSTHGKTTHGPLVQDLDLIGVREYNREGGDYVPCASCMLPQLERRYPLLYEAVAFVNADRKIARPRLDGIPTLDNTADLDSTISWLASGEIVLTNSYHGVYWATLLGKKVVCFPYSSKFHGFKFPPVMTDEASWKKDIKKAVSYPEALQDCRAANHRFYEKVLSLTGLA